VAGDAQGTTFVGGGDEPEQQLGAGAEDGPHVGRCPL
jgi:hypothetical protein